MKYLQSTIDNSELLRLYGYEPYDGGHVASRWLELTADWSPRSSQELGHLRQIMLQIHLDLCPDDER